MSVLREANNTELYAQRPEVMRALVGLADLVMRRARADEDGEHIIAQTKRRTLALRFDRRTRIYTLTTQDGGSWTASGRAAAMRTELIYVFDVQEEAGAESGRQAA